MNFRPEIEGFIKDYVRDLRDGTAAIFAGAGLSKSCGFVDWPTLLRDIAKEIGLEVDREHDLVALAQFHVNHQKSSAKLARKIIEEFSEQAESSDAHDIIARLPIRTYWTTNYDTLIEDALRRAFRIADVKRSPNDLNVTRPKRDAVIYKMHGDVLSPNDAILYKEQYEKYYQSHERFVTALSGDLVSKTFLFVGFSFSDPNLDYVLSRLHAAGRPKRTHYAFVKRSGRKDFEHEDLFKYALRKQELQIDDLKRFGIQPLLVDDYAEIPAILREIQSRFLKGTVFVSGSAEEFGDWSRADATNLVHSISSLLVRSGYRVVNGFGWGVGSAVINGALEVIYGNPEKFSEDQLVMRPFPQSPSNGENLADLWEQYRQRMIGLSGVAIFVFGNKLGNDREVVVANGVIREFEIAANQGVVPIPIGATGYAAAEIWKLIREDPTRYYGNDVRLRELVTSVCREEVGRDQIVVNLQKLLTHLRN